MSRSWNVADDPRILQAGVQFVAMDRVSWESDVRDAASRDDRLALADLFAQAVAAWGRESASKAWWTILSATDAGAVTG